MYAQITKSNSMVTLIGDNEVGLPVFNHPLVDCIDIGGRIDIRLGMKYDKLKEEFYEEIIEPQLVDTIIQTDSERIFALEALVEALTERAVIV